MTVPATYRLLIVEDDPLFCRTLRLQLNHGPFALTFCGHTEDALRILTEQTFDLILLDIHLGGHEEGLVALPKLIEAAHAVPVVVHSVLSDHATVVRAMRQGAYDYIPKHVGIKTLDPQLQGIIRRFRAEHVRPAADAARQRPSAADDSMATGRAARPMLGDSPAMQALHAAIARANRSQGSVIILGEPGSGKELVARAMARARAPFIAVDASTLDSTLATGLLFGHERGAFTGADSSRAGLFEQAHGGVLYIDEIANMTLDVQAKLLRVLQEREVTRLGAVKPKALQFRLVCATHADLPALCRDGKFRFDLLTRLQVFVIEVPPLRHRLQDVPQLFRAFVKRAEEECSQTPLHIAPKVYDMLQAHSWPGNVRELQHAAQFAVAACSSGELCPEHLPILTERDDRKLRAEVAPHQGQAPAVVEVESNLPTRSSAPFHEQVRHFEITTLRRAYARGSSNISALARELGMDRSSLYAKLRLYGIHTRSG